MECHYCRGSATVTTGKEAYAWLAAALGLHVDQCHIGMFDLATCERVMKLCDKKVEVTG